MGREVVVRWNGRPVRAWVPDPLASAPVPLSEATVRRTEQAAALARRGSDELPPEWERLARLLLRAEGLASSGIEGITAPLADVAVAELDPASAPAGAPVAENLRVVRLAVEDARRGPLEPGTLDRWQGALLAGSTHLPPELVGRVRGLQGWIGGTSPLDAALVTPPPERVPGLVEDLVAFANRTDLDAVTQAAVAHAQFEVVHPYADGNGRVGRVLVAWGLTRRLGLVNPPPVSVRIAADRGGYLAGLTRFRLGDVDGWVRWFADVVVGAGEASVALVRSVAEVQDRWRGRVAGLRADATARRVLDLLPQHPVVAASTVAGALGVSERAGRTALESLGAAGVLRPFTPARRGPGRPRSWWVAPELVDLVGAWAR